MADGEAAYSAVVPSRRQADSASRADGIATDIQRRLHRAEMLLAVTAKLAATQSLDDVLQTLVGIVVGATDADRGSLFLYDEQTRELYSRVAQGEHIREIRFPCEDGIAGFVFATGTGVIVDDAYADPRFNPAIDGKTGFITRTILSAPVRTVTGEVLGVAQCLNKRNGYFSADDLELLQASCTQAAAALRASQRVDRMERWQSRQAQFLEAVAELTSERDLGKLLTRAVTEITRMLGAERSTLFLNDAATGELWSEVGEGLGGDQIRMANTSGIAGHVFTTGETVNIPHAYADVRFNPAFDQKTGFFTRSILCVPVANKRGEIIGVTQVLNKNGGPFTEEDEKRLKTFTGQIAMAIENASLFREMQNIQNYHESVLQSMSNGVITLDERQRIVTCNVAGLRLLGRREADVLGRPAATFFAGSNAWILDRARLVAESGNAETTMDGELLLAGKVLSVNVTVLPLIGIDTQTIGTMIVFVDITIEKRVKSTMARYLDARLADQLLASGDEILGGNSARATILFSDIRGFTTLSERLGPQGTVALLNEYFTIMVDCVQREGGMLDKFIGDAMLAAFGIPIAKGDDEDRGVRAAITMVAALRHWNNERAQRGLPTVAMGIGLNTDVIVSGNIGSPKRMDYTVIGDGVNLAARLESACKRFHTEILISEQTRCRLKTPFRLRPVDTIIVKGRTQPVDVFEVLDHHTEETYPNLTTAIPLFTEAVDAYRQARFAEAAARFAAVLDLHANDRLACLYLERCRRLMTAPPEQDWRAISVLDEK